MRIGPRNGARVTTKSGGLRDAAMYLPKRLDHVPSYYDILDRRWSIGIMGRAHGTGLSSREPALSTIRGFQY
jgi:hypothetical protein